MAEIRNATLPSYIYVGFVCERVWRCLLHTERLPDYATINLLKDNPFGRIRCFALQQN